MIKVLHVNGGSFEGGAARGVLWLHEGFQNSKEVSSEVLFENGEKNSNWNILFGSKRLHSLHKIVKRLDNFLIYFKKVAQPFSVGFLGANITKTSLYNEADIIHLHWTNNCMISIKDVAKINKPIVWTIRDMWPITGGCHVAIDCNRYKSQCGRCPALSSKKDKDLSTWLQDKKHKAFSKKNLFAVAISEMSYKQLSESRIFRNKRIEYIPNCINFNQFYPDLNNVFGSQIDTTKKKIVLCGATSLKDKHKGFHHLIESLQYLDLQETLFVFFGNSDISLLNSLNIDYVNLGYLNTDQLRNIYSLSDVFVMPSLQESFGKTALEALACNTAVVCFDSTGVSTIVDHKINGYQAKYKDSEDLAKGIDWVLRNLSSKNIDFRTEVEAKFSNQVIASKYTKLYKKILNENS